MEMESESGQRNWAEWLGRHGAMLLLFARTQTRCAADAEDIVQETLAELSRKHPAQPPGLPAAYITLRRRAIDLGRTMDRRQAREQASLLDAPTVYWFENTLERDERSRLIDAAMKRMPQKHREVVVLKLWGDLTFAEIAQTLAVPMNTAASRYRYGLEFLKQHAPLSHL